MTKKKLKNPEDLKGFEDYLESLNLSTFNIKENTRIEENYELYTFIEQNNLRLKKIIDLFGNQNRILKNFPQDIGMIIKQEAHNMALREKISKIVLKEDSNYTKHLEHIFNNFFN